MEPQLTKENAALRAENKARQIEIKLRKEKIALLVRRIFGAKSEQQGDDETRKAAASSADVCPWRLRSTGAKDNKPVKARREREARVPSICPPSMK